MKIISLDPTSIHQSDSWNKGIQTFTSMISGKENFIFLNDHIDRLLSGADYLFPEYKWPEKKKELVDFLSKNFVPSHYFRLVIVEDCFFFLKKPHAPKSPHLSITAAQTIKSPSLIPSYVKNGNYLKEEIELRIARKNQHDDVLFFDQSGNLTEASTSNVFVVLDHRTVLTPKTSSMVLEGVTRKKLIEFLKNKNFNIMEVDIGKSELESSREIWLTNAIQGLRLVDRYEKLNMFQDKTLYQDICLEFGRFGEKFKNE